LKPPTSIPSQDAYEDDFPFTQVGYVIIPWRVSTLSATQDFVRDPTQTG